jgi:hypothetical protein
VSGILPGTHTGIVRAGYACEAFCGYIGVGWVKLGGLQYPVNLIKKLEKRVVTAVAMGDVFDEAGAFYLIHRIICELCPGEAEEVLYVRGGFGFDNVDTFEAFGHAVATSQR